MTVDGYVEHGDHKTDAGDDVEIVNDIIENEVADNLDSASVPFFFKQ